jgi:ABC-type branched-subunit amino acid transport system permease subunit
MLGMDPELLWAVLQYTRSYGASSELIRVENGIVIGWCVHSLMQYADRWETLRVSNIYVAWKSLGLAKIIDVLSGRNINVIHTGIC